MTTYKWLAFLVFATTIVSALTAETSCPGNVASLPFLLVNHHQMIVAVSVNHAGPYNFLLDTGMQVTLIDPSLAAELHLQPRGLAVVAGAGSRQSASYVPVDLLEAGSHAVPNQNVLIYEVQNLQGVDLHIRGILGEDFLEHFDMLVDNVHSLLCLDETAAMRTGVKGPHIPLASADPEQDSALPGLPIILVRLSDATRPVRLLLDSGTNGAILYNTAEYLNPPRKGYLPGAGVDGKQRMFPALPLQDVKIGSLQIVGVQFVSLGRNQKDARAKGFDGVLTFGLFRRVFISHADHFAVLEPR
jgi:Aspartyl protease